VEARAHPELRSLSRGLALPFTNAVSVVVNCESQEDGLGHGKSSTSPSYTTGGGNQRSSGLLISSSSVVGKVSCGYFPPVS
jgi:hypothetical protein